MSSEPTNRRDGEPLRINVTALPHGCPVLVHDQLHAARTIGSARDLDEWSKGDALRHPQVPVCSTAAPRARSSCSSARKYVTYSFLPEIRFGPIG